MAREHFVPNLFCFRTVIHADGQHAHAKLIELFVVLRELAQFGGAVRSPIAAIEDQQHRMTAQRGEVNRHSSLVAEREIRRRLSRRGCNLRRRQTLLRHRSASQKNE
jgi:hypothetical protein